MPRPDFALPSAPPPPPDGGSRTALLAACGFAALVVIAGAAFVFGRRSAAPTAPVVATDAPAAVAGEATPAPTDTLWAGQPATPAPAEAKPPAQPARGGGLLDDRPPGTEVAEAVPPVSPALRGAAEAGAVLTESRRIRGDASVVFEEFEMPAVAS